MQNWKGPTLAKLLHHPCQDSHEGPAAYCQKNPSKLLRPQKEAISGANEIMVSVLLGEKRT